MVDIEFLTEARALAEDLMRDSCVIRLPSTLGPLGDDGIQPEIPGAIVYEGRCRVQDTNPQPDTPTSGAHRMIVPNFAVHIPVSAGAVKSKHLVTITAIGPLTEPSLLGRHGIILEAPSKSYATARRLSVEEVAA